MEEQADEDVIEATIRRLDADKKARKAAADRVAEDDALAGDAAPKGVDESAIEATIRRIEAEQRSRDAGDGEDAPAAVHETESGTSSDEVGAESPSAVDESAIEATIRRIEEQKARDAAESDEGTADPVEAVAVVEETQGAPDATEEDDSPPPRAVDETAIEATIRRIEEEQARRSEDLPGDEATAEHDAAPAAHVVEPSRRAPRVVRAEPAPPAPPERDEPARPPVEASPAVQLEGLERIERGLAQTAQALAVMLERLDTILPLLERALLPSAASAPQPIRRDATPPASSQDDEWEDAPLISRMQTGLPPRPAILRDPSPAAATAEHLVDAAEEDVFDTRPLPEPMPPLQQPERRGFDLLPRSYRITVEDRGRSVDLVPLHRALLGMEGVRDMSLLSYNNGVAIVSLETTDALEPDTLRACVARAMSRPARVETNNNAFLVKLGED